VWGVAALGIAAGIAAVAAAQALSIGAISSRIVETAFSYSGIWLVLGLASVTIRDVEKPHGWSIRGMLLNRPLPTMLLNISGEDVKL
jgi:hypothetical protein